MSFGDFSLAKSSHLITAVDVNSTAVSPEEMGPHSEAYTSTTRTILLHFLALSYPL